MGGTLVELLVIFVLTVANGVFSMSETALLSARKARLFQRAEEGDTRAKVALRLADSPGVFLSTVQIGITLIGTLLGAFSGATLAEPLGVVLAQVPFLAPYSQGLAFALIVIFTTFLSLIIGELVPKQLALGNPEAIASRVARPMETLSRLAGPLIRFLDGTTKLVVRLMGIRPSDEPTVTPEEITTMIAEGTVQGTFEAAERDLVRRIFRLDDLRVEAIMTPRPEVAWFEVSDSPTEIRRKIRESGRSRFPVTEGGLDNVIGVVRAKDLLARSLDGKSLDLRACMQPPLFVPGSTSALMVIERFKETNIHLGLVLDEYGGLQGVLTMTDVMNRMIGGQYLGEDINEPHVVTREDGSFLLDGMMTVDEVKDALSLKSLPGEDEGDFQTLSGFVMAQIGRIPQAADHFIVGDLRFEVVDMDGHRVDKVMVMPAPPPTEDDEWSEK